MKKIFFISAFVIAVLFVNAQQYSWRLTYDVNAPMGDFNSEYISKWSWRGIGLDNRWMLNDKVSAGFNVAWHTFYEKVENATASTTDGSITAYGTQFRYLNTGLFQANIHYYLGDQTRINPWIGLGIGGAYSNMTANLGFYSYSYTPWSLSVSPQAGIDIPFSIDGAFTLGVRYNYLMNTENQAPISFSYLGFNAGFKFSVF